MCFFFNVCVCVRVVFLKFGYVCVGFVMCVFVCMFGFFKCVDICMFGFCDVWMFVCVGFVKCVFVNV